MEILTDSHFVIGKSHNVCQDYALHGETQFFHYNVVCDGCSGSPKSDMGARLLAEIFVNSLDLYYTTKHGDMEHNYISIIRPAMVNELLLLLRSFKGFREEYMDGTLVANIVSKPDNIGQIFMWGDGVIEKKYKGCNNVYSIQYSEGYPYYFSYLINPSRYDSFIQSFSNGNKFQYSHYMGSEMNRIGCSGQAFFNNEMLGGVCYFSNDPLLESISIFSDGIYTFGDDWKIMLPKLTEFKNPVGRFVLRKVRRVSDDYKKLDKENQDDFSMATMVFKQPTPTTK